MQDNENNNSHDPILHQQPTLVFPFLDWQTSNGRRYMLCIQLKYHFEVKTWPKLFIENEHVCEVYYISFKH